MMFDTVLVGYNTDHTVRALAVCNRLLRWRRSGRRVLVCNRPELANTISPRQAQGWEIIHGSNRFGEFSGWQEGIDHIGRTGRGVFLANDSITVHSKFTSARRFALSRSFRRAGNASVVGFLDRVEGKMAIKELPFESWVRTNCFGLTPAALEKISFKLLDTQIVADCVNGGLDEQRFFSHLSPDLEHRLRQHLFHGGWYASEPLSERSVKRLLFKARCIVLEKWLAARCAALNIEFVDPFVALPAARNLDKAQSRTFSESVAGLTRLVRRSIGLRE